MLFSTLRPANKTLAFAPDLSNVVEQVCSLSFAAVADLRTLALELYCHVTKQRAQVRFSCFPFRVNAPPDVGHCKRDLSKRED
jgi:hypothetical protein